MISTLRFGTENVSQSACSPISHWPLQCMTTYPPKKSNHGSNWWKLMLLTELTNDNFARLSRFGVSTVDILRTLHDGLKSASLTNLEIGTMLCDLVVFIGESSADIISSLSMYLSILFFKRSDIRKYLGWPCSAWRRVSPTTKSFTYFTLDDLMINFGNKI